MRSSGAEIGFGQDPDGDRLAVADETGRVLDNDDVLALAVDAALRRLPGDVVVNLTTSSVIDEVAAAHGRRVYRTPVGEANVVEMMQAVKAVIGGEGSNGGIIFPAVHLCRDSYTGMAFLLERMAETGETISALAARLPRFYRKLGKVAYEHGRLGPLMQALEESFPGVRDRPVRRPQADPARCLDPRARVEYRAAAAHGRRGALGSGGRRVVCTGAGAVWAIRVIIECVIAGRGYAGSRIGRAAAVTPSNRSMRC